MRRYTEETSDALVRSARFRQVKDDAGHRTYWCLDGTLAHGGTANADDLNALRLPWAIARGEVVPVPVTDAKGRRIKG